jgi:general secretion pathway protein M
MLNLNLKTREKYALMAAAAAVVVFVIVHFFIFPSIDRKKRMESQLVAKKGALEEMIALSTEYQAITSEVTAAKAKLGKRSKGFRLFSFLDSLAGQTGLKDHIVYMRPSTKNQKDSPYKLSIVEMKLQGVNMEQLIAYLHKIETSRNMIQVRRITITKNDKKESFVTSVLQVETLQI